MGLLKELSCVKPLSSTIMKKAGIDYFNGVYILKTRNKILSTCRVLLFANNCCENQDFNGFILSYFVGSSECSDHVNPSFCNILKNNADSVYTFSFPEIIIEFPNGVLKTGHDANPSDPFFFTGSFRYKYKIEL